MDAWTSSLTHNVGLFSVIGFVILLVIGFAARIVWTRSKSERSESVLGAIGGPSTYRFVRKK
jgi:hypothetical protein